MLAKSSITAFLMIAVVTARGGINLTPSVTEYVAEGMKFHQLTFQDGKRRIEYEPPRNWSFDGGANELRLKPPKNFAEAIISATPAAKAQTLDATAIKLLEEQVTTTLPNGSQFVKIEQELENVILLDGNNSFEITLSYQLMGEKFSRSVLFVKLPDTQLVFRLTARKDDFALLHQEFRSSILSWHSAETPQAGDQAAKVLASDSAH